MSVLRASLVALVWTCIGGCGSTPPEYSYKGVLVQEDGSPAAGVPVIVTPASSIMRGIPKDAERVTTDSAGRFSGGFANDMDGEDWARLPLHQMPPLPGVYVWVHQLSRWRPIPVSLYTIGQKQRCSGGEKIILPRVRLTTSDRGAPPTRPSAIQPWPEKN